MMKKHWKAITGTVVSVVVALAVVVAFLKTHPIISDEQSVQTASLPSYDSGENYIVLEIVPDDSYKQLSYLQAGKEPIDIFKASNDGNADKIAKVVGKGVQLETEINGVQYKQLEAVYSDEKMSENFVKTVSGAGAYAKQTKYELKSKQAFPINKNLLEDKFAPLMQSKGMESIQIVSVTSKDLNDAEADKVKKLIAAADAVIMHQSYVAGAEEAQKELAKYTDAKETGKTFVDNDIKWSVAKELFARICSKTDHVPFIMDSSIYQNALDKSDRSVEAYQYKLNREVKYKDGKPASDYSVFFEDGSEEKSGKKALFSKTSFSTGTHKASNNNAYKVFLMSMFRDPIEFNNLFMESGLIESEKNYRLQGGAAAEYWSTYTFLPCKGDLASDKNEYKNATEEYWESSMAITLNLTNENYINTCVVSWDAASSPLISSISSAVSFHNSAKSGTKDYNFISLIRELQDYTPKANLDEKKFNVLELQPAKGFDLSPVVIERMIPYTSYSKDGKFTLNITKMTTAEFIGRTEDLTSEYDMIYIGNNTDGFWKKDNGGKQETYFGTNNKELKGKIYLHVGAKVNFGYGSATTTSNSKSSDNSNGQAFFTATDGGFLRFSGNDITKIKREQLETYIGAGLPITVASGLCEDAKKSDPKYFDNKDYNNMYQFIHGNSGKLVDLDFNYRTASEQDLEEELSRLTKVKPYLTVTGMASSDDSYSGSQLDKNVVFNFKSTTSNRKITFNYKIEDDGAGNGYRLEFYIDKNADGRFVNNDKEKELVGSRATTAGNNSYSFNLNTNYRGAFTWKLVAYPNNNKDLKCSQIGYGTIRFSDVVDGKKVRVLQVQAVAGNDKHRTKWGREKARQVNLRTDFAYLFEKDEVKKDYDITVDVIDLQDFTYGNDGKSEEGYWKLGGRKSDEDGGGWLNSSGDGCSRKDMANKYDMIVFGFADSYRDLEFNDKKIARDVDDFITVNKKSVLFTHDLTSQINNQDLIDKDGVNTGAFMETTNGKGFNQWLRDRMGMNRFKADVTAGNGYSSENYDTMADAMAGESDLTDSYGFTYTALMQYSNFRRAWSGDVKSIADTVRDAGFLGPYKNLVLNLNSANKDWPDIFNGHYSEHLSDESERIKSVMGNDAIQSYGTNRITNVNNGQITSYPFDLSSYPSDSSGYEIALTHGQYYQLNMEDEEIVCWYALSDNNSEGKGWYTSSPNDVSNNYYIYNKGNVTYSGVGHSKVGSETSPEKGLMTDFEKKLFVNTIIASLRAGVEGPGATIENAYNVPEAGEDCYVVYADVDVDSEEEEFKKSENVEFYATDDGTDKSKVYVVIEWYDDEKGEYKELTPEQLTEKNVSLKALDGASKPVDVTVTKKSGGTAEGYEVDKSDGVSANKKYVLEIPREILKDKAIQKFRIVVYDDKKAMGYTNGGVIRRPLFKLD